MNMKPTADEPGSLEHIAFYRFVEIEDVQTTASWLSKATRALLGSVLVAPEGINGVLAGEANSLRDFETVLCGDPRFAGIAFKRSRCRTAPFARMKVHARDEIVAVGVARTQGEAGRRVGPQAWRELLVQPDVIVLDNRNSFEYRLGRFEGAIDPHVSHFRDFPRFVLAHADEWKRAGQRVAMYCTGGIRCEKTSGWMQGLGLDVVELDGGILGYFQALPDAHADWQGECFVFDNRIALDTRLHETATTADDVYAAEPDGQWRLARARRLDAAAG